MPEALTLVEEALAKLVLPVKELTPEKVLELASKVVEATMIELPRVTEEPLIVMAPDPCRRLLPMVVVAVSLPLASVERSDPVSPVNQVVPRVANVVVELAKLLRPVQVLELERSVVEATEIEEPAVKVTPLMVPREPVR